MYVFFWRECPLISHHPTPLFPPYIRTKISRGSRFGCFVIKREFCPRGSRSRSRSFCPTPPHPTPSKSPTTCTHHARKNPHREKTLPGKKLAPFPPIFNPYFLPNPHPSLWRKTSEVLAAIQSNPGQYVARAPTPCERSAEATCGVVRKFPPRIHDARGARGCCEALQARIFIFMRRKEMGE